MDIDYLVEADGSTAYLVYLLLKVSCTWEDNLEGYSNIGVCLGEAKETPNMLSLTYSKVSGKVVCFYWGTSTVVNHLQISDYLKKEFPNKTSIEASSFVHKMREF